MCGIIGYVGSRSAAELLVQGLRLLEYRGYDSWGLATLTQEGIEVIKRAGKISDAAATAAMSHAASTGIGHTRWATHGPPTEANAHPHTDAAGTVAVVHNGIIENASALRRELEQKGVRFRSDTDTEVIPHLLAECYQGDGVAALREVMGRLVGALALGVLFADRPGELYGARRSSPLAIGVGDGEMFLASDPSAIVAHTRKVMYLGDDEVARVTAADAHVVHVDRGRVDREAQVLPFDAAALDKGGFESFMLKEIHEQPESLRNACRGRLLFEDATTRLDGMELTESELRRFKSIKILGCGTSWHAALLGKYVFEELARIPTEVDYAAEFRYRNPIVPPDCLTLAVSQSGETADTLAALREAKSRGATVAGICNVVGSSIARECGRGIYLHAGPEVGVASTKAFSSQVLVLTLLAIRLGRMRDLGRQEALQALGMIQSLPALAKRALQQNDAARAIAEEVHQQPNFLFTGRRYQFPVALEGALKLKEISYAHAEGLQAAELKHGPIALIDENMPTVVLATESDILDKVKSNVQEIRARHGRILAVVTEGCRELDGLCDWRIEVPQTPEYLTPILTVIPLQLLAHHVASLRGCNVDKPRNLAKSVTVE